MTIDQLKRSLTEQGITLPPSRSKKADYLKLYKQYSTVNDSLGDVYSSDDENPPRTGSQNVTSSTSPGKNSSLINVEELTDDELYRRLKEFDPKIGPVLKNTRSVYEKKLMKMLSSVKEQNGYESGKAKVDKSLSAVDEFSDSDVDMFASSPKKADARSKKISLLKGVPKPSFQDTSKGDVEKSYSVREEYSNRSATPLHSLETKTSRYSYIETIPKGSSYGYIEDDIDGDFDSDFKQKLTEKYNTEKFHSDKYSNRASLDDVYKPSSSSNLRLNSKPGFSSQFKHGLGGGDSLKVGISSSGPYKSSIGLSNQGKSGAGYGDHYIGSWEPNINRYLNTGVQKKVTSKSHNYSEWLKKILAGTI